MPLCASVTSHDRAIVDVLVWKSASTSGVDPSYTVPDGSVKSTVIPSAISQCQPSPTHHMFIMYVLVCTSLYCPAWFQHRTVL